MRARLAASLTLMLFIFGACGGRFEQLEGGEGQGGASASGASPKAGSKGVAGGVAMGGSGVSMGGKVGVGGTASGGAITIGGVASGGGCACPVPNCAAGYRLEPNIDGCCFHCVSVCRGVACPAIDCAPGNHLEMSPNQCCPVCVQDSCQAQQVGYQAFRNQLIDKYASLGCMTNQECTLYYEKNQCGVGCGVSMPIAALTDLDSNLQNYAQQNCSPDCPLPIPPCVAPLMPQCVNGRCQ